VLVLLISLGTFGYLAVRSQFQSFSDAADRVEELENRYGSLESFQPAADGRISQERIEAFLSVRDKMAKIRAELEAKMGDLAEQIDHLERQSESGWRILGLVREGFEVIPELGRFHAVRADALLSSEMGMGEYCYLYVLSYYVWLGNSPSDGPSIQSERGGGSNGDYVRWIRKTTLLMLKNQLRALKEADRSDLDSWRSQLESEIEALESDQNRIPWEDGLPSQMEASLEAFRQKLQGSYSKATNPLELGPWADGRRFRWRDFAKKHGQ
jgi:hypothetical protein